MSDTDNIVDADTINDANIIGDAASGAILYSMTYSEPIWYEIVTASRSTILDNTDIHPIVSTIDNAYRSHNLGLIYEIKIEGTDGNIIV